MVLKRVAISFESHLPQIGTKLGKSAYVVSRDKVSDISSGHHNISAVIKQSPTKASDAINDKAETTSSRDRIVGNMVESPSMAKLIVTTAVVGAAVASAADVDSALGVATASPDLTGKFHLFTKKISKHDRKLGIDYGHCFLRQSTKTCQKNTYLSDGQLCFDSPPTIPEIPVPLVPLWNKISTVYTRMLYFSLDVTIPK